MIKLTAQHQVARLHYLRIAPRKVRLIASSIRGLSVNEAEARLTLLPHRAAEPILKLIRSAIASAKHVKKLQPKKLMVESITVDQGPMLKRFMPRARGSASPIQKKTSHITLVLKEVESAQPERFTIVVKKRVKKTIEKKAPKAKKESASEEGEAKTGKERSGMLKKMFRRKAI